MADSPREVVCEVPRQQPLRDERDNFAPLREEKSEKRRSKDKKMQSVKVMEDMSNAVNSAILSVPNPAFSSVYDSAPAPPHPLRTIEVGNVPPKNSQPNIPPVITKKNDKKEDDKVKENIEKVAPKKPPRKPKDDKRDSIKTKDKNKKSESIPPPEVQFEKIYEEIVQDKTPVTIDESILQEAALDAEELQASFDEIVHAYQEKQQDPVSDRNISESPVLKLPKRRHTEEFKTKDKNTPLKSSVSVDDSPNKEENEGPKSVKPIKYLDANENTQRQIDETKIKPPISTSPNKKVDKKGNGVIKTSSKKEVTEMGKQGTNEKQENKITRNKQETPKAKPRKIIEKSETNDGKHEKLHPKNIHLVQHEKPNENITNKINMVPQEIAHLDETKIETSSPKKSFKAVKETIKSLLPKPAPIDKLPDSIQKEPANKPNKNVKTKDEDQIKHDQPKTYSKKIDDDKKYEKEKRSVHKKPQSQTKEIIEETPKQLPQIRGPQIPNVVQHDESRNDNDNSVNQMALPEKEEQQKENLKISEQPLSDQKVKDQVVPNNDMHTISGKCLDTKVDVEREPDGKNKEHNPFETDKSQKVYGETVKVLLPGLAGKSNDQKNIINVTENKDKQNNDEIRTKQSDTDVGSSKTEENNILKDQRGSPKPKPRINIERLHPEKITQSDISHHEKPKEMLNNQLKVPSSDSGDVSSSKKHLKAVAKAIKSCMPNPAVSDKLPDSILNEPKVKLNKDKKSNDDHHVKTDKPTFESTKFNKNNMKGNETDRVIIKPQSKTKQIIEETPKQPPQIRVTAHDDMVTEIPKASANMAKHDTDNSEPKNGNNSSVNDPNLPEKEEQLKDNENRTQPFSDQKNQDQVIPKDVQIKSDEHLYTEVDTQTEPQVRNKKHVFFKKDKPLKLVDDTIKILLPGPVDKPNNQNIKMPVTASEDKKIDVEIRTKQVDPEVNLSQTDECYVHKDQKDTLNLMPRHSNEPLHPKDIKDSNLSQHAKPNEMPSQSHETKDETGDVSSSKKTLKVVTEAIKSLLPTPSGKLSDAIQKEPEDQHKNKMSNDHHQVQNYKPKVNNVSRDEKISMIKKPQIVEETPKQPPKIRDTETANANTVTNIPKGDIACTVKRDTDRSKPRKGIDGSENQVTSLKNEEQQIENYKVSERPLGDKKVKVLSKEIQTKSDKHLDTTVGVQREPDGKIKRHDILKDKPQLEEVNETVKCLLPRPIGKPSDENIKVTVTASKDNKVDDEIHTKLGDTDENSSNTEENNIIIDQNDTPKSVSRDGIVRLHPEEIKHSILSQREEPKTTLTNKINVPSQSKEAKNGTDDISSSKKPLKAVTEAIKSLLPRPTTSDKLSDSIQKEPKDKLNKNERSSDVHKVLNDKPELESKKIDVNTVSRNEKISLIEKPQSKTKKIIEETPRQPPLSHVPAHDDVTGKGDPRYDNDSSVNQVTMLEQEEQQKEQERIKSPEQTFSDKKLKDQVLSREHRTKPDKHLDNNVNMQIEPDRKNKKHDPLKKDKPQQLVKESVKILLPGPVDKSNDKNIELTVTASKDERVEDEICAKQGDTEVIPSITVQNKITKDQKDESSSKKPLKVVKEAIKSLLPKPVPSDIFPDCDPLKKDSKQQLVEESDKILLPKPIGTSHDDSESTFSQEAQSHPEIERINFPTSGYDTIINKDFESTQNKAKIKGKEENNASNNSESYPGPNATDTNNKSTPNISNDQDKSVNDNIKTDSDKINERLPEPECQIEHNPTNIMDTEPKLKKYLLNKNVISTPSHNTSPGSNNKKENAIKTDIRSKNQNNLSPKSHECVEIPVICIKSNISKPEKSTQIDQKVPQKLTNRYERTSNQAQGELDSYNKTQSEIKKAQKPDSYEVDISEMTRSFDAVLKPILKKRDKGTGEDIIREMGTPKQTFENKNNIVLNTEKEVPSFNFVREELKQSVSFNETVVQINEELDSLKSAQKSLNPFSTEQFNDNNTKPDTFENDNFHPRKQSVQSKIAVFEKQATNTWYINTPSLQRQDGIRQVSMKPENVHRIPIERRENLKDTNTVASKPDDKSRMRLDDTYTEKDIELVDKVKISLGGKIKKNIFKLMDDMKRQKPKEDAKNKPQDEEMKMNVPQVHIVTKNKKVGNKKNYDIPLVINRRSSANIPKQESVLSKIALFEQRSFTPETIISPRPQAAKSYLTLKRNTANYKDAATTSLIRHNSKIVDGEHVNSLHDHENDVIAKGESVRKCLDPKKSKVDATQRPKDDGDGTKHEKRNRRMSAEREVKVSGSVKETLDEKRIQKSFQARNVSDKIAMFERIEMQDSNPKPALKLGPTRVRSSPSPLDGASNNLELASPNANLDRAREKYGTIQMPRIPLNDGSTMPVITLSTATLHPRFAKALVCAAIDMGYRAIDTAPVYGNEVPVGEAIREKIAEGVVARSDLYVISKCSSHLGPEEALEVCRSSLRATGLDYFDLYLVQNPVSIEAGGGPAARLQRPLAATRAALLPAARSVGVADFTAVQLERVATEGTAPVICLIESARLNRRLSEACSRLGVRAACSSAARPGADDPLVGALAAGLGVTATQLLVRYQLECGHCVFVDAADVESTGAPAGFGRSTHRGGDKRPWVVGWQTELQFQRNR